MSDQGVPITDRCIRLYFNQDLPQAETTLRLSVRDNVQISPRHLRRRLAQRVHFSDPAEINFISNQVRGPGCLRGYRMMHEKCRLAGLCVT